MKYLQLSFLLTAATAASLIATSASAATFTGYDENQNPFISGSATQQQPLTIAQSPNSQAAFNNFSAKLNGATVTTESFETTSVGTAINGLVKTISGTNATFQYTTKASRVGGVGGAEGSGTTAVTGSTAAVQQKDSNGLTNSGTYPTDGSRGISINSANDFSISFANTIAAFSYFGTDLGDNNNQLTMKFYNGTTLLNSSLIVPGVNSFNSSKYFFGYIADNPTLYFNKVVFSNSINSNGDAIGIDQLKIASAGQLTPVPEPSSIVGTLIFGGAVILLKRRQK